MNVLPLSYSYPRAPHFICFPLFRSNSFEEPCFADRHLSFALAVGVTQIMLYAIGLPMIVYIFLWRHRGELDKPVVKFRYGLFFAGFRQERYYWECVVALRKESTVVLAVFGSQMGVAMLAHVALLVFMVQILVQLIGHPYGRGHSKLQMLDVGAICLCWGTMWSGFFFYTPRPPDQKAALVFLTMTVVLVNTIYMMILLYSMCSEACKEHKDHSVVQVFQKRTSDFRDLTRKRLVRMVMRETAKIETIHVSNPGMGHFAEVEMTGRGSNSTEQKRVASVGTTPKGRSWITKRKGKKISRPERLPGGAAVPSAAQAEQRKRLHSLHTRRTSREESKMLAGFGVRFNPMMKQDNDDAEAGDAGATIVTAGNDGGEMGGIEIYYDDDGDAYSYNPVTGETAWLESDEEHRQ